MLEKTIEKRVVKDLEGFGCFVAKFVDLSRKGAPDRLGISPFGVHLYVETKTEKGRLSPHQLAYHKHLRDHHCWVITVNSMLDWTQAFHHVKSIGFR